MYKTEGIHSLYRGMVPNLLGVAPYVGVNYLTFESLKEIIPKGPDGHSSIVLMASGAVAGTTGQTVAYPLDLLRRRFQMVQPNGQPMYTGTLNAFSTIIREEGFIGLYKGFLPNFVKVVPTIAIMFFANDIMKRELRKRDMLEE